MEKRFDSDSSSGRMTKNLIKKSGWAKLAPNGTIKNVIDVVGEEIDEVARYLEHLYIEKKFRNARTFSALSSQADLVSYKPSLARAAQGFIIVSHKDSEGNSRLMNFNSSFFDIDDASDYDDIVKDVNTTTSAKSALVPWTAKKGYTIRKGTTFFNNYASFIATEDVTIHSLKTAFSNIKNDDEKYEAFIKAGGWNGIKYLKVPVIQGEVKTQEFGIATGSRFESFILDDVTIDRADDSVSAEFLKVFVTPIIERNNQTIELETETWEKVENIGLAGPSEKVFEMRLLNDKSGVLIKFGNGISGSLLPVGSRVSIQYLSTLGEEGNVEEKFSISNMTLPNAADYIDPRTGTENGFLECLNIEPILNGKNIDSEEDIRENAPSYYLKSYAVTSKESLKKQIEEKSPVRFLTSKILTGNEIDVSSYGKTEEDASLYLSNLDSSGTVLQELTFTKNPLTIVALDSNGEKIEDPESEVIEQVMRTLDDRMAPSESLSFIQPNIIEIRPEIEICLKEGSDFSSIQSKISEKILNEYSIFCQGFDEPIYKSKLYDFTHDEDILFSKVQMLAKAKVDETPKIISTTEQRSISWLNNLSFTSMEDFDEDEYKNESLLKFNFKFDKEFALDEQNLGFKNFKDGKKCVLKAELIFKDDTSKNRTLLLLDSRNEGFEKETLNNAQFIKEGTFTENTYGLETFKFTDPTIENTNPCRVAQFSLLEGALLDDDLKNVLDFSIFPQEILPYAVDNEGVKKEFTSEEVDASDRVSLKFDNNESTKYYKKNWEYIDHCSFMFNEDYDATSKTFASGFITLPVKYILTSSEISSLKVLLKNTPDYSKQEEIISQIIKNKLTINVFAEPRQEELTTAAKFDILKIDADDVVISERSKI